MDELKNLYQRWLREEIESPEVQDAKEAFLRELSEPAPARPVWNLFSAPVFRFALVGCFAALIVFKVSSLDHSTTPTLLQEQPEIQTAAVTTVPTTAPVAATAAAPVSAAVPNTDSGSSQIQIRKLGSQVGPTVAYQKSFSDVQITVLWVFPKGV